MREEEAEIKLEEALGGGGGPEPDELEDGIPTVAQSRAAKIIPGQRLEVAYRNVLKIEAQMAKAQRAYAPAGKAWNAAEGAYLDARNSGSATEAELARLKRNMDDADRAEQRARRVLDAEAQRLGFQTPESFQATIRHCRRLMDPRLRLEIEEAERAHSASPKTKTPRCRPASSRPPSRPLPPAVTPPGLRSRIIAVLTSRIVAARQRRAAGKKTGRRR
ncbi:hypothetical protein GCM10027267_11440 [Paramicrobacterium agarici]